MSFNKLLNKDWGSIARNKLNTMLEELYELIATAGDSLWGNVTGDPTKIEPKDGKGIRVSGGVFLPTLVGSFGSGETKLLVIDETGEILVNASGISVFGPVLRKIGIPDEMYINFGEDGMTIVNTGSGGISLVDELIKLTSQIKIEVNSTPGTGWSGARISDETGSTYIQMDDTDIVMNFTVESSIRIENVIKLLITTSGMIFKDSVLFEKIPRLKNEANVVSGISASFTLTHNDVGKYFRHTGASDINITVPEDLNWYNGESARFRRTAAGNIQLSPATGNVTLHHTQGITERLYDVLELIKVGTNEYDVRGVRDNLVSYRDELQSLIKEAKNNASARITENYAEGTLDYAINATPDDYALMNIQINHDWEIGSNIYPHLHWFQSQNNRPNWLLQYRWQKNGAAKTTSWTNLTVDFTSFPYSSGTILQISAFDVITPPIGAGISDIIQIRIIRDTANASGEFGGADPYTAAAVALNFDIHMKVNSLGSEQEYEK